MPAVHALNTAAQTEDSSCNMDLLRMVGETVHGQFWQKPMALRLGMSQRQMIRWRKGAWDVPDVLQDGQHLAAVLKDIMDAHQEQVTAVRKFVVAAIPETGRPGA